MEITVNGRRTTVAEGETVLGLLGDDATAGVAVALNATVVRRSEWARTTLGDADRVEILRATQGG